MSIEFGDDAGPDDMFDASNPGLDPEAVTIRFHEERVRQGDTDFGLWHELSPDDRAIALFIGARLVEEIRVDPDPGRLSEYLADIIEYLSGERPSWLERRRQRKVLGLLVDALRNEGTIA